MGGAHLLPGCGAVGVLQKVVNVRRQYQQAQHAQTAHEGPQKAIGQPAYGSAEKGREALE